MEEETKLIWHKSNVEPNKKGWYLCKIRDLEDYDENGENCEWGPPYFNVVWYNVYWDCDGVPIAWAEIPECKFDVE